uniref:Cytochrome P450 CYP6CS1v2 n=1 Tax=Nilaparvata lugens TaxID=108931 RepID=A0A0K0LC92_NILLU|nr:cytochrome P450 CYP6CS1v2 [Nilaparvata lugens]
MELSTAFQMLGDDGFFNSWWVQLLLVILVTLVTTRIYASHVFSHWHRKGLASCAGSFPFGSIGNFVLQRKSISEVYADIYRSGKGHKLFGYYSFFSPSLLVRDPELIRLVLVKDFPHFMNRGAYYNEKDDPLSAHIFSLDGEEWKKIRTKVSPFYATNKMKFMFDTIRSCSVDLQRFLLESSNSCKSEFELKGLMSKYSINVIAQTAIGMEGNNFKDKNMLSEMSFKVTDPDDIVQTFRFSLPFINRNLAALLKLRFTPKATEDYYMAAVRQIIEQRKRENVVKHDFMHLLLQMKGRSDTIDKGTAGLSVEEIAAQTFIFILAGHETSSSTIAFCLHELALDSRIQQRLCHEIDASGVTVENVTFEQIQSMEYLDAVFQETLRKYPPAGVLIRECIKDYECPDGFVIKKGTRINVSNYGLHRDPHFFPNPDKFDPGRFDKDSPSHPIVPFSYLPFGEGPRFCLGKRFAMFTVKLGLFAILSKFSVESTGKSAPTVTFNPALFLNSPKDGLHIRFVPRTVSI